MALISSSGSGGSPDGIIGDICGGELLSSFLNSGLSSRLKLPFFFSGSGLTLGVGTSTKLIAYIRVMTNKYYSRFILKR